MGFPGAVSWLTCLLAWAALDTPVLAARLPNARHIHNDHELLPPIIPPEHASQTTSRDLGTKTFVSLDAATGMRDTADVSTDFTAHLPPWRPAVSTIAPIC